MRRSTIIALAASAVVACLVLVGASSALATESVLCKKNETPCLAENIYPQGSTITAEALAESDQLRITTTEVTLRCTSRIKATVGSSGSLTITEWALGLSEGCRGFSNTGCTTNSVEGLPYEAVISSGVLAIIEPELHFVCNFFNLKPMDCTYFQSPEIAFSEMANKLIWTEHEAMAQTGSSCWGKEAQLSVTFRLENPIYESTRSTAATTVKANHITATGATLAGTVNPNGAATEYWFEYGTSTSYGTKTSTGSAGSGTSDVAVSKALTGLTSGTTYHYRVVSKDKYETHYGDDMTVVPGGAPELREEFEGTAFGESITPAGLAVTSSTVWIVDHYGNEIEKWSRSENKYVSAFGEEGSGNGQFNGPSGIAIDKSGNLWVTDTYNNRIQKFSPSGKYLLSVKTGEGGAELIEPEGIAVDAEGNIWVADTGNEVLQEFDTSGKWLSSIASMMTEPTAIAFSPSGTDMYVTNYNASNVVQLFRDPFTGKWVYGSTWGSKGSGNGQFSRPIAIATDSEGNVWVQEQGNQRVQEFTSSGAYITKFTSWFEFERPGGIATDAAGNIFVSNIFNYVQRWSR
jgi:sugar lactone lactonase YvrE